MYNPWLKLAMDMTMLGFEAQAVIAQRVAFFALGKPGSQAEAERMVLEKLYAAAEAGMMMATGASNEAVIRSYRRKIHANSVRLAAL